LPRSTNDAIAGVDICNIFLAILNLNVIEFIQYCI
jgi:hypothetical protein